MLALILCLVTVMADQVAKQAVRSGFALGQSVAVVDGFFHLTYVRNTGAAWGMLHNQTAFLALLSAVVLVVMIVFRKSFVSEAWDQRLAFGLMLGGILGNLIDRVKFGWVTDFLDFRFFGHPFPTFNIADSAICIGVALYLLSNMWWARETPPAASSETESPSQDAAHG